MNEDRSRKANPETAPPDWEAIARFLAGESSPDEAARVRTVARRESIRPGTRSRDWTPRSMLEPANVDVEAALRERSCADRRARDARV